MFTHVQKQFRSINGWSWSEFCAVWQDLTIGLYKRWQVKVVLSQWEWCLSYITVVYVIIGNDRCGIIIVYILYVSPHKWSIQSVSFQLDQLFCRFETVGRSILADKIFMFTTRFVLFQAHFGWSNPQFSKWNALKFGWHRFPKSSRLFLGPAISDILAKNMDFPWFSVKAFIYRWIFSLTFWMLAQVEVPRGATHFLAFADGPGQVLEVCWMVGQNTKWFGFVWKYGASKCIG